MKVVGFDPVLPAAAFKVTVEGGREGEREEGREGRMDWL
jgi:hypothetical protein